MEGDKKKDWRSELISPLAVAILVAAFGFVVNGLNDHRKELDQYVGNQIEKVYGPLFVLNEANTVAWTAFRKRYFPERPGFFVERESRSKQDIEVWRSWMRNVFQPQNQRMEDAIVANAHLLIGDEGTRTMLSYLLSPLQRYRREVMRER